MSMVRVSLLLAVTITAAASILAPTAGAAAKPDLVITDFKFKPSPAQSTSHRTPFVVLENDGSGTFGLAFKVKNNGKRKAGASTVRIVVGGKKFGTEQVGPIRPGKSKTVD